ncbi:hypothetical protein F4778DRAFT_525416 [Xylariomycetidae sp. FL2044]|nr:hypothetical protein F4778DRAFT_525416 [Xylariomycetidae sp. FL2044]
MAATAVDAGYLATHLGVPPENISSLVTTPTADLVNAVLAAVTIKAREYDSLYTAKVGLEVEFETRVRGAEAQRNASNESAKAARKEVDDLRQKLKDEGTQLPGLTTFSPPAYLLLTGAQRPSVKPWKMNYIRSSHPRRRPNPKSRPSARVSHRLRPPTANPLPSLTPRTKRTRNSFEMWRHNIGRIWI